MTAAAAAQTVWFIDPILGNDNNDGLTAATAIQFAEEMRRRIGDSVINQPVAVNLLGDLGSNNPLQVWFNFGPQGIIVYFGTPTILFGPSIFTAGTGGGPGANVPFDAGDNAIPAATWTLSGLMNTATSGPRRLRCTIGNLGLPTGAVSWTIFDGGIVPVKTTRFTPWILFGGGGLTFVPTAGQQTYVVESLSSIADLSVDVRVSSDTQLTPIVTFRDVFIPGQPNVRPSIRANNVARNRPVVRFLWSEVGQVKWCESGINELIGCKLTGSIVGPEVVHCRACAIFAPQEVQGACTFNLGTVFQGVPLTVKSRALAILSITDPPIVGDTCGIMNTPGDALEIQPGAEAEVGNLLYGSENGGIGVVVRSCSQMTYFPAIYPISLTGGGGDRSVGGVISLHGLPTTEAAELAAIRREL